MLDLLGSSIRQVFGLKSVISVSQVIQQVSTCRRTNQMSLISVTIKDTDHLEIAIDNWEKTILIHTAIIPLILEGSQIFNSSNTMILVDHRLIVISFTVDFSTTTFETNEFKATFVKQLDITLIKMIIQILL